MRIHLYIASLFNIFKFFSFTSFVVFLPIFGQCQTYDQPFSRQISKGFYLEKIILSDTQTVIKAYCVNDTYKPSALISTPAPKSNNAFRLIANQEIYKLTKAIGIPTNGENLTLPFGDTVNFELIFPAIPTNTKVINIVEGASQVTDAWMAYGIQLVECKTVENQRSMFLGENTFKNYFENNRLSLWEIEGFWEVEGQFFNKKKTFEADFKKEKVVIVRENNAFNVYRLDGSRLNVRFDHFRREKYVINFPIDAAYPTRKTFKYKIKFESKLRLSKKHVRSLKLGEEAENTKVYFQSNWRFLGYK
ncbi:MAG: hypothetical protein ACPG19_13905 [Saprospiraceae bacterium]